MHMHIPISELNCMTPTFLTSHLFDQEETGIAFSGLDLVAFTSLFPVTRCLKT